jgi:hypothetical protein
MTKAIRRNNEVANAVRAAFAARVEHKRYSLATANTNTTTGGLVVPLTQALLVGDTISSRTGDVVTPEHLDLVLNITNPGSTLGRPIVVRTLVFQDTLNVGIAPIPSDVLDGATYGSTYTLLTNQQKRFRILHDKSHVYVVGGVQATMEHLRFKLKGKIYYNGDTNAVTSNGKNSLWILVIASSVNADYQHYSSLVFTDA